MNYERLLSYGNVIQLKMRVDVGKLKGEISSFDFDHYNPNKPNIPRYGLSITSLDGEINGVDLDSLYNTDGLDEMSFRTFTDVYYASEQIRSVIEPFKDYLGRSHLLKFGKGGFFPPHRDDRGSREQKTVRIICPIFKCKPPTSYLILDDKIQYLQEGGVYFMNTNLEHSFISYGGEALMMILNVEACEGSYKAIFDNLASY